MRPPIQGIQGAFFAAMAAGWAQDIEHISGMDFMGMKIIPFVQGDYRIVDGYLAPVDSDGCSTGMTVIYHRNVPVWAMHYGGHYTKTAIPFLKQCLHKAYVEEHRFYGGRGPQFVRDERFTYVNIIRSADFSMFEGEEFVFDLNEQLLGTHWYKGGILFAAK